MNFVDEGAKNGKTSTYPGSVCRGLKKEGHLRTTSWTEAGECSRRGTWKEKNDHAKGIKKKENRSTNGKNP